MVQKVVRIKANGIDRVCQIFIDGTLVADLTEFELRAQIAELDRLKEVWEKRDRSGEIEMADSLPTNYLLTHPPE